MFRFFFAYVFLAIVYIFLLRVTNNWNPIVYNITQYRVTQSNWSPLDCLTPTLRVGVRLCSINKLS
jgi:hypothetical protein